MKLFTNHRLTILAGFVLAAVLIPAGAWAYMHSGRYDVAAFFDPDGGPYGKVAWRGLAAYAAGLAAEWPFVRQPRPTGPPRARLGGPGLSWLIGRIVSAPSSR